MTPEEYFAVAKSMWHNFVPKHGQADTVQGELIRAIEKVRDEAQRNGNGNFNKNCHVILIKYIRKFLINEQIFDPKDIAQINGDLDKLLKPNSAFTEDELYVRITSRIVDWYLKNPNPIPHKKNAKLYC